MFAYLRSGTEPVRECILKAQHIQYTVSTQADEEFCNILCAWENLEKTLGDGETIVDFNLTGWKSDRQYSSRAEVLLALDALSQDHSVKQDRKVMSRVIALQAYLKGMTGDAPASYSDYIRDRIGIDLVYIPDEKIAKAQKNLEEKLRDVGSRLEDGYVGLAACNQSNIAADDIPAWFAQRFKQSLQDIKDVLGEIPDMKEPIVVVEEPEHAAWVANVRAEGDQFRFAFNRHYVKKKSVESLTATFNHEVLGHAVQGYYWKKEIEEGRLPKSFGLTTVIGPESLTMEALAEYAPLYYGDMTNPNAAADEALRNYDRMVFNNAYYLHYYEGRDDNTVKTYLKKHAPYRDDLFIEKRMQHVFKRLNTGSVYSTVYDVGRRLMQEVAEQFTPDLKKEFLANIYRQWLDATDIANLARSYGVDNIPDFNPHRSTKLEKMGP